FGDGALQLRQAPDVGKDRLVADGGLRGACPAGHGGRQGREDVAWRRRWLRGFACLHVRVPSAAWSSNDGRHIGSKLIGVRSRIGGVPASITVTRLVPAMDRAAYGSQIGRDVGL